ncbi:MAG: rhomboid family intramembrane serine protease [Oscillospiraceae bacterium]
MQRFNSAVDRFCYKHPRFGINNLMLYIIIGNALVYVFSKMDTTGTFVYYLYFNPELILQGQIWRLITFILVPTTSGLLWLALMLYFYYFIGSALERYWGAGKFTIYYLTGVIFTMLYGLISGLILKSNYMFLDASYINLSMFFTFAVLFPDTRVLLFFIFPVKIKWLAVLDAVFFVLAMIGGTFPTNFLPLVAVLNFFLFCGGNFTRYFKTLKFTNSKQSVNFRSSVHRAKYEEANKPYHHRCSVCGKTDTDYPNMEFRYCSRCTGYHCFCEEHINNHVHFQ